jgi:hypothetical protein
MTRVRLASSRWNVTTPACFGPSTEVQAIRSSGRVPRALDALGAAGFTADTDAPEDWLAKVWDRGNLVDLIFRLSGEPVTEEILGRVDAVEVGSVQMPVLSATDLVVTKLLTYRDHYADFGSSLPMVRALREQVDWAEVRRRTGHSPFAEAFLLLADRLGLTG